MQRSVQDRPCAERMRIQRSAQGSSRSERKDCLYGKRGEVKMDVEANSRRFYAIEARICASKRRIMGRDWRPNLLETARKQLRGM